MIGSTLAHYTNLDAIGAGGMGEVYRARDTTLERGRRYQTPSGGGGLRDVLDARRWLVVHTAGTDSS